MHKTPAQLWAKGEPTWASMIHRIPARRANDYSIPDWIGIWDGSHGYESHNLNGISTVSNAAKWFQLDVNSPKITHVTGSLAERSAWRHWAMHLSSWAENSANLFEFTISWKAVLTLGMLKYFLYKPREKLFFFQFGIIVSGSSFCFIWIHYVMGLRPL